MLLMGPVLVTHELTVRCLCYIQTPRRSTSQARSSGVMNELVMVLGTAGIMIGMTYGPSSAGRR